MLALIDIIEEDKIISRNKSGFKIIIIPLFSILKIVNLLKNLLISMNIAKKVEIEK